MVASAEFPSGKLALKNESVHQITRRLTSSVAARLIVGLAFVTVQACASGAPTASSPTPTVHTVGATNAAAFPAAPGTNPAVAPIAALPTVLPKQSTTVTPAPSGAETSTAASPSTVASTAAQPDAAGPRATRYAFPIAAPASASYSRTHHDYPAADVFARCGSAVVAIVDGTIDQVNLTDRWTKDVNDPTTRGGLYVSISGDDGVRYYTAHLQSVEPTAVVGARVEAGDLVARVGKSGDTSACHVHLGISPICATGEWWVRRGVIWPARYLDAWRKGVPNSPSPEIDAWSAAHPAACASPGAMPWPSR